MSIIIDIAERYVAAFGYLPSGIPRRADIGSNIMAGVETAAIKFGLDKASQAIIKPHIQHFAVNVFDRQFADLTLKNKDKIFKFHNGILTEEMPGVIATAPAFSFKRGKTIKTTPVDNSNVVVVESWGSKQWEITMSGLLIELGDHEYPSEKLQQFREMFEIDDILEVLECQLLDDLNVKSVYIEDIEELKFVEGYNDTVQYKIKAWSIKPAEFFI
jgi:hypothetical protein